VYVCDVFCMCEEDDSDERCLLFLRRDARNVGRGLMIKYCET
jgi:hypothetical protein